MVYYRVIFPTNWVIIYYRSHPLQEPGIPTTIKTMGVKNNHHCLPKGFNHRNGVNHFFDGGGSPGKIFEFKHVIPFH